ncbi:MAG: hypothetical protein EBQ57_03260 [Actinobacteria bacterium]|jgi:hypothetical protein|nr:hypothetical protein [Actinomycetota bacterium]
MFELTFVDAVLAGRATAEDVDDWIERWHTTDTGDTELHEFLGLNEDEMGLWVSANATLEQIIARRETRG